MDELYCPELNSHYRLTLASHEAVCSLAALLHMQSPCGIFHHGALVSLAEEIHRANPTRSVRTAQNLISIARKCARCYRPLLEIYRQAFVEVPHLYRGPASAALSNRLTADLDKAGCQHHQKAIDEYLTIYFAR